MIDQQFLITPLAPLFKEGKKNSTSSGFASHPSKGEFKNKFLHHDFTIDKGAPVIVISGVTDKEYRSGDITPVIEISDVTLDTKSITINGQAFISGTILAVESNYSLVATATDKAGNTSATTYNFTIDKTQPTISITGVNDGEYRSAGISPVVNITDVNPGTQNLLLNGNAYASGTPLTAEGNYILTATATDKAGNTQTATVKFTVDTSAPQISFSGLTNGEYRSGEITPVISITDTNLTEQKILLNGIDFASGTILSADKDYVLTAQAKDKAGNSTTLTYNFTIDRTAPTISFSGLTDHEFRSGSITPIINIGDTNLDGQTVTLNGQAFTSGTTLAGEGNFILAATATDKAGNSATLTYHFTIDTNAPEINVSGVTDGEYRSGNITPIVDVTDVNIDSQSVILGEGLVNGTTLTKDGEYQINAEAKDKAGNSRQVKYKFTIDKTAPTIAISGVANGEYRSGDISPVVNISDVNLDTQSITLNGNPATSVLSLSEEGNYTLTATAADKAGNSSVTTYTFTIDKTAPVIGFSGVMDKEFRNGDVNPIVSISDTNMAEESTFVILNGVKDLFINGATLSAEGNYELKAAAADRAGNYTELNYGFVIDKTPPALSIKGVTNGEYRNGYITPIAEITDKNLDTESRLLNENPFENGTVLNTDGVYTLALNATDKAGNSSALSYAFTIDRTAPSLNFSGIEAGKYYSNTLAPVIEFTDTNPDVQTVLLNGQPYVLNTAITADGVYTLVITLKDKAGNITTLTREFTIDQTMPVINISGVEDGKYYKADVTPVIEISETNIGSQSITLNDITFESATVVGEEKEYNLFVVAIDKAGNKVTRSIHFTIDKTLPAINLTNVEDGYFNTTIAPRLEVGDIYLANAEVSVTANIPEPVDYTMEVNTTDSAGNVHNRSLTFTQQRQAPYIQVAGLGPPVNLGLSGEAPPAVLNISDAHLALSGLMEGTAFDQDGTYTFMVMAADRAGNLYSVSRTFVIDKTLPEIQIAGLQDDATYNTDRMPEISFTDLNMDSQGITLNGDVYASGTPVTAEGEYHMSATTKDKAGNKKTVTYDFIIDKTPPQITINNPSDQAIIPDIKTTIVGKIDDVTGSLCLNGETVGERCGVPLSSDGSFSIDLPLTVGWNDLLLTSIDPVGNQQERHLRLLSAPNPPAIAFGMPAEVKAGETIGITVSAADEFFGITFMDISINGYPVEHVDGDRVNKEMSKSLTYTVPIEMTTGETISIVARAGNIYDFVGENSAQINVTGRGGIGVITGEVYDDRLGLPLADAIIVETHGRASLQSYETDPLGTFTIVKDSGAIIVSAEKTGYTWVERVKEAVGGKDNQLIDFRLTPLDAMINDIGVAGGIAFSTSKLPSLDKEGSGVVDEGSVDDSPLQLTIPANALPGPLQIRLTEISNQGLANLLPLGWSPIYAVDVSPDGYEFDTETTLKIKQGEYMDSPLQIVLVRYDRPTHEWVVVQNSPPYEGGDTGVVIPRTGQYAFVVADDGIPIPDVGANLVFAQSDAQSFDIRTVADLSGNGGVMPEAAVPPVIIPFDGLRDRNPTAKGEIKISSLSTSLPSGVIVQAKVNETYDLQKGERQTSSPFTQDLVLYRYVPSTGSGTAINSPPYEGVSPLPWEGGDTGVVKTSFPLTPSRSYTIAELLLGKITIGINVPQEEPLQTLVGANGGRLFTTGGLSVEIPDGALPGDTAVKLTALPLNDVIPANAGIQGLAHFNLDIGKSTLTKSANIYLPTPTNYDPNREIFVAIKGEYTDSPLRFIGMAHHNGPLITTSSPPNEGGDTGVVKSGEYLIIQPDTAIGFVQGVVRDAGGNPKNGVIVSSPALGLSTSTAPLLDKEGWQAQPDGVVGSFLIPVPAGEFIIVATLPGTPDTATYTGTVDVGAIHELPSFSLRAVGPEIVSTTPANNAVDRALVTPVVIKFNHTLDAATINSDTVKMYTSPVGAQDSEPLQITIDLAPDKTLITLYPGKLSPNTQYSLVLSEVVKDAWGRNFSCENSPPYAKVLGFGREGGETGEVRCLISLFTTIVAERPNPPAAGTITTLLPDAEGYITLRGTQGSLNPQNRASIANMNTLETASININNDGSFTAKVRGEIGDEVILEITDSLGNVTPYKSAIMEGTEKEDGSKLALVMPEGGKLLLADPSGLGNQELTIKPDTFAQTAVIKARPVSQSEVEAKLPSPEGVVFGGAIELDTGGAEQKLPMKLSVPLPSGVDSQSQAVLMMLIPKEEGGYMYAVADSAKIEEGTIHTASWPFPGIRVDYFGGFWPIMYVFWTYPPAVYKTPYYTDEGYIYWDNGDGIYAPNVAAKDDQGNDIYDVPVSGAIVEVVTSRSSISAIAGKDGHYAVMYFKENEWESYLVKIKDPVGGQFRWDNTKTGGYVNRVHEHSDIMLATVKELAAGDTDLPEVNIKLTDMDKRPLFGGTLPLSSKIRAEITAKDRSGIRMVAISLDGKDGSYPIENGVYTSGEIELTTPGAHTIRAEATDNAGKTTVREESVFVMFDSSQTGAGSYPGGPKLITVNAFPRAGMRGVSTGSHIYLPFSEKIQEETIAGHIVITAKKNAEEITYTYQTKESDGQFIIELIPDNQLKYGLEYQVNINSLYDVDGEVMDTPVVIDFKVNAAGTTSTADAGGSIKDIGSAGKYIYILKTQAESNGEKTYLKGYIDSGFGLQEAGDQTEVVSYTSAGYRGPKLSRMAVSEERKQAFVLERRIFYYPEYDADGFKGFIHAFDLNGVTPLKSGDCRLPDYNAGHTTAVNGHYLYIGMLNTFEVGKLAVMDLDQAAWGVGDCRITNDVYVGEGTRPVQAIGFVGSEVYVGTSKEIFHLSEGGDHKGRYDKSAIGLRGGWFIYGINGAKDYQYIDAEGNPQTKDVLFVAATDWTSGIKIVTVDVTAGAFAPMGEYMFPGGKAWLWDDMLVVDPENRIAIASGMNKTYYLDIGNPAMIKELKTESDRAGRLALDGDGAVYSAFYMGKSINGIEYKVGAWLMLTDRNNSMAQEVRLSDGKEALYDIRVKLDEAMEAEWLRGDSLYLKLRITAADGSLITYPEGASGLPEREVRLYKKDFTDLGKGEYKSAKTIAVSNMPKDEVPAEVIALYGGLGRHRLRMELIDQRQGGMPVREETAGIEGVEVVVMGIDGLRQDVLYNANFGMTNNVIGDGINVGVTPEELLLTESGFDGAINGSGLFKVMGLDEKISGSLQESSKQKFIMKSGVTAIFPSITLASWASVFSGKESGVTGIMGNEFFARDVYQFSPTKNVLPGLNGLGGIDKKTGKLIDLPGIVTLSDGAFHSNTTRFMANNLVPSDFVIKLMSEGGVKEGLSEISVIPNPEKRNLYKKFEDSLPNKLWLRMKLPGLNLEVPEEKQSVYEWMNNQAGINSLYNEYPVNSASSISNCVKDNKECRSIVISNHYAQGTDYWGTASKRTATAAVKGIHGESYMLDHLAEEGFNEFIDDYYGQTDSQGKIIKKKFPVLSTVYFAGLDHEAHGDKDHGGMGVYKEYLLKTLDKKLGTVASRLKEKNEFNDKIFIITADHGHTATPVGETLTFPVYYGDKDLDGNLPYYNQSYVSDTSCKLNLKGFENDNLKYSEQANSNLHIYELAQLFQQFGLSEGLMLLVPAEIEAVIAAETKPDPITGKKKLAVTSILNDANVIAALNGPMAHVYVRGGTWTDDPDAGRLEDVILILGRVIKDGANSIDPRFNDIQKLLPNISSSIDVFLRRKSLNGSYEVVDVKKEIVEGAIETKLIISPLDSLKDNPNYVKPVERITGMNHPQRSGDIIMLMKFNTSDTPDKRYTTGVSCKSWHGSLNKSDSYVPFILAYPGGNKYILQDILKKVCPSGQCDGNWKTTEVIKQIIETQYSGQ